MKSKSKNHPDLKICYSCFSLHKTADAHIYQCPLCSAEQELTRYNDFLDVSKKIVRYGYQYRKHYEEGLERDPALNYRSFLEELNSIYSFIVLSMLSGVLGNYAHEGVKGFFKKLKKDPLIIEIEDKEFKKLLEDEDEQEQFMKCVQEFRDSKINSHPKVVAAIAEEIQADDYAEKMMNDPYVKNLIAELEAKEKTKEKKKVNQKSGRHQKRQTRKTPNPKRRGRNKICVAANL